MIAASPENSLARLGYSLSQEQTGAGRIYFPIDITDAADRVVRLEKAPQKIFVVGHGPFMVAHLLYMFPEGRSLMAGLEKRGENAGEFLPLIDPEFSQKIILKSNPGPEEIAAHRPDLILIRGSALETIGLTLLRIGIPVLYVGLETPEQFNKDTANLGVITNNPARAKEITAYFKTRLDCLGESLKDLRDDDKPRVLTAMHTERGGRVAVRVPPLSWMQTIQTRAAGGNPVWAEAVSASSGWTVVNLEQISRWDPDMIFIVAWNSLDVKKTIDQLKADALWGRLRAVRKGTLYAFPTDLYGWDSPDPRWILGMTWLAQKIHPQRFPGLDIRQEIFRFYEDLYAMTKDDVEKKIMPAVRMDFK